MCIGGDNKKVKYDKTKKMANRDLTRFAIY